MKPLFKIGHPIKLKNLTKNQKVEFHNQEADIEDTTINIQKQTSKQVEFLSQISGMFNKFFKIAEKQMPDISFLEARDRKVRVDLPELDDKTTLTKPILEQWVNQISKNTFSTAFNSYFKDEMTFQQAKIYCSENIMRNLALLAQKYNLTKQHMEIINFHMKNRVLPYMNSKYPMTAATDINKAFQKIVKEVDNFDSINYDFIINTKINFEYRQSGNYNDIIMRFLNEIMMKIDNQSKFNPQLTNFKDFQNFTSQIFTKVQDEKWVNQKQNQQFTKQQHIAYETMHLIAQQIQRVNISEEDKKKDLTLLNRQYQEKMAKYKQKQRLKEVAKEKYRTKVKEYTHFSINRKISQNTDIFSQNQIKSMNLTIKSPAILRILTKWCEQLQQKYTNQNFFKQMTDGVKIQKTGRIIGLFTWMKDAIAILMKKQNEQIEKFLKEIKQNNNYYQSALLNTQVKANNQLNQVDNIQKASAKTCFNIVDSLHNYIIHYLNILIHGLLKVAKNFYDQQVDKSWEIWKDSPVNLISFKVGDLMRCKFSSKEKEILKVFKEIQRISEKDPNKMRIIRIKNRLKLGTNDILVNVRFNNEITCQIQLAIISNKSKFIQYSAIFNHYLYQLQRSLMGPVTQMCCIWINLDPRFKIYQKMIKAESKKHNQRQKCKQTQSHELRVNQKPFICNICTIAFSQNNFIKDHLKCANCEFWICARCLIQQQKAQNLQSLFFKDKNDQAGYIKVANINQIPNEGACILIQAKKIKVEYFKKINLKGRFRLFGRQNQKIYEIFQITSLKQKQSFLQKYLVYKMSNSSLNQINLSTTISQRKVNCQYILPNYLLDCSKKQKQKIQLLQERLQPNQWLKLFKFDQKNRFKLIKSIQMRSNYFKDIDFIYQSDFPHLQQINIEFNNVSNKQLSTISRFKTLKKLIMGSNQVDTIQPQFCTLNELEVLDISQNKIRKISDQFCSLKNLKDLQLNRNSLPQLPDKFDELQNLKFLNLQGNIEIYNIACLKNLSKLQTLLAGKNKITIFSQELKWYNLKTVDFSQNRITSLPETFYDSIALQTLNLKFNDINSLSPSINKLKSLVYLNLQRNKLIQIPKQIEELQKLKTFIVAKNELAKLPIQIQKLKALEQLQIWSNKLQYLSNDFQIDKNSFQIDTTITNNFKIKSILTLKVNNNKLVKLPPFIQNLQLLTWLCINDNQIESLDGAILSKLTKLKKLNIDKNKIKQLPNQLFHLYQLEYLSFKDNLVQVIQKDLSKLVNLKNLEGLQFSNNQIKYKQNIQCLDFVCQKVKIYQSDWVKKLKDEPPKQVVQPKMQAAQTNVETVKVKSEQENKQAE